MGGKTPSPRPKSLAPTISKQALLARNSSRPHFKTRPPRPKSLAPTISKHALLARNRSRPLFGRSKVTLLSPTLSTQTQAQKPKCRGRTVTPPHISDKCVRKPLPIPHSYLVGAKSPSLRKLPSPQPRNLSPSSMAPPPHQIHRRPPPQCRRRCPFAIMHWAMRLLICAAGASSTTAARTVPEPIHPHRCARRRSGSNFGCVQGPGAASP
jgi:hypothetical protein